jgi:hypothetical protein
MTVFENVHLGLPSVVVNDHFDHCVWEVREQADSSMCLGQSPSIDEIASEMNINPGKKLHKNDTSPTEDTYF